MRNALELFEMYKDEKSIMVGKFDTRSGLEEFPSYHQWKLDYTEDFLELHVPISHKEATRVMSEAVASGDTEMIDLLNRKMKVAPKTKNEKSVKNTKKPKRSLLNPIKKSTRNKSEQVRKVNKAAISREIFDNMYPDVVNGKSTRKAVISKFIEAGLTNAGASTYYQRWKKESA